MKVGYAWLVQSEGISEDIKAPEPTPYAEVRSVSRRTGVNSFGILFRLRFSMLSKPRIRRLNNLDDF